MVVGILILCAFSFFFFFFIMAWDVRMVLVKT